MARAVPGEVVPISHRIAEQQQDAPRGSAVQAVGGAGSRGQWALGLGLGCPR